MEPRTGKTKTVIDYLSLLAQARKIDRAIVICPSGGVMDVWVEEIFANCPIPHTVHVWDKEGRRAGSPPKVHRAHQLTFLVVNYEAFGTPGRKVRNRRGNVVRSKKTGRNDVFSKLKGWALDGRCAGVLDESHKIKSPSGKASTMIVRTRPWFLYRVIMTGTPVTKAKRVFDLYMQWKWLNPDRFADVSTADEFKNRYGKWTHRNGFPQFLGQRNMDEVRSRIHQDAFAITRAECYDLPPQTTNIVPVKLTSKTAKVYDDLARDLVADFEHDKRNHTLEAGMALTLALRLSQVTGGMAKTTEGDLIRIGNEKLQTLSGLIEAQVDNDEPAVICARFRADLDAIAALCTGFSVPVWSIRGGMTRADVGDAVRSFRRHDGASFMVMNPASGGLGIDLSRASHMIWYGLTNSWVQYIQTCDRIALSRNPTTVSYLLAEGTVDTVMYDTLGEDTDVGRAIVKNPRILERK